MQITLFCIPDFSSELCHYDVKYYGRRCHLRMPKGVRNTQVVEWSWLDIVSQRNRNFAVWPQKIHIKISEILLAINIVPLTEVIRQNVLVCLYLKSYTSSVTPLEICCTVILECRINISTCISEFRSDFYTSYSILYVAILYLFFHLYLMLNTQQKILHSVYIIHCIIDYYFNHQW